MKIKLFGRQPIAKISDRLLDTLIERDYKGNSDIAKAKLENINSDSQAGKNRIAAAVLKLADKNIDALDQLIEKANEDSRDILLRAEYRNCAKLGFDKLSKEQIKQIYMDDFVEYSNWINNRL